MTMSLTARSSSGRRGRLRDSGQPAPRAVRRACRSAASARCTWSIVDGTGVHMRSIAAVIALLLPIGARAQEPQPLTTGDGTRYTYFSDGLVASIEHAGGSRETFDHDAVVAAGRLAVSLAAELPT